MATSDQPDNGQTAYNYYVSQGLSPVAASGIVGNLQGESGQGLDPTSVNKGDGADGSDSIGIGQWNGQRAQGLKDYAASKGVPWTDLNTQLEYLHSELQGPEKGAYQGLLAAQTPEQAGQAMLAYERPKDWNKPGAHPERGQYAARAYAAYAGGGQPQAPGAPLQIAPQAVPRQQPAPTFLNQQPSAAASADDGPIFPMQTASTPAAPILLPQRRPIDLSGLKAALAAYRAPIFASSQG